MKAIVRTAIAVTTVGVAGLGSAGAALAAPLEDPAGLCSNHDDHGNCWFAASAPSVDVNMVFPANDPREQAIVDYLTKTVHDFDDNTTASGLTDPKPQQELGVTAMGYASGSPPTGTGTTVVTVYSNEGGPYPNTYYKSFGYDDATKAPITFRSLFRPDSQPLNVILPIVQDEMTRQAGQPITIDPSLGLDPVNYQNFAITNDAVIFFFDKDQLHPAYGDIQVSVPRSAIAAQLSPGL